jgi:RNA polymerase sigma-70 factor, ECF subfamily
MHLHASSLQVSQRMTKTIRYTDEELIKRFQNGDENAYAELIKRYTDPLLNFVYRFVNDEDQAEDIVQDTMVKLFTHKHYYKEIAKFSTWIYTIAGNLAKTELRKRKRQKTTQLSKLGPEDMEFQIPSDDAGTDEGIQSSFIEKRIQAAIQNLEPHFRTAIILRDIQELSYEEISNILSVPLGTVKSRINRGRLELQTELKDLK